MALLTLLLGVLALVSFCIVNTPECRDPRVEIHRQATPALGTESYSTFPSGLGVAVDDID